MDNSNYSSKNGIVTLVLCVLLGSIGVHRFYVGKIGTGIAWLLTGGIFGIGWVVDIIMIVLGNFKDADGRYVSLTETYDPVVNAHSYEEYETVDADYAEVKPAEPVKTEEPVIPVIENSNLNKIRNAIELAADGEVKDCLYDIEKSVRKIDTRLKDDPSLENNTDIRKYKTNYLPQTVELIDKYTSGECSDETRAKIKDVLFLCRDAFRSIERKIFEADDMDTLVDIEVLRNTFAREGLTDSDFDL